MAYSKGKISIPNVTGNIAITVTTAKEITNLFDKDDSNVLLKGRLNSSGAAVSYADGQLVTGFIEAKVGDTIIISTDSPNGVNPYTGMVGFYDAGGGYLWQAGYTGLSWNDNKTLGSYTIPDHIASHDISNTAKIRVCVAYTNIGDIIITK